VELRGIRFWETGRGFDRNLLLAMEKPNRKVNEGMPIPLTRGRRCFLTFANRDIYSTIDVTATKVSWMKCGALFKRRPINGGYGMQLII
jgi:hypothetical protein